MNVYAALESLVNEPPAEDVQQIVDSMSDAPEAASFEEYFQDVNDLNYDIANDVADVERCIEVAQVLGEVTDVVSSKVSEATPTEARLTELVGDMAVAGTDANPEDVVPSMEAYADGPAAMKKVKENIAKMWEWLKKLVAKITERLKYYFKAVFQSSVALDKRLHDLEEQLTKADATTFKGGKVAISAREASSIALGTVVPENLAKLKTQLDTLITVRQYFFAEYHGYLVSRLTGLRDAIMKFDPAHPDVVVNQLAEHLKGAKFPMPPGMGGKTQLALMGQHQLVIESAAEQTRKQQAAAVSAGHYLEVARKTVVEVHRDTEVGEVKKRDITCVNLGELRALVSETIKFVNGIEAYTQQPLKDIESHHAEVTKVAEALAKKLQQHADKDQGAKAAEHAFSLISNQVASVSSWIDQPLRTFTTYALREAAAIEAIAAKAFKQGEAARPEVTPGRQDYKPAGM